MSGPTTFPTGDGDLSTSGQIWTGLGLVAPLEAMVNGAMISGVSGISIDTRTLQQGDLYIAIKGDVQDGHNFVKSAFEKGAAAAVVDEAHLNMCRGLGTLYVVRDTLKAMEALGRAARARSQAGIVGVTGSVGKTGTKEMLRVALAPFGSVHASAASYNNHWGVPLTLARLSKLAKFGVFEIGMNHAGEITPLVGMVRPLVAIITTIAPVHLEHFQSIDGIADAKAEIFSGLQPGGTAIIHRDVAQFERLKKAAIASPAGRVLSFGEHATSDARLLEFKPTSDGSVVVAEIMGQMLTYALRAPGKHQAVNSLAVLLAAHALGQDVSVAAKALSNFSPPTGRGKRLMLGSAKAPLIVIDESYNANPTSMAAALTLLGETDKSVLGRRIAVLGDMLELGPDAINLHKGLRDDILRNKVDRVYACGPMMKHLFDALPDDIKGTYAPTSEGLHAPLLGFVGAEDVVMVKGSNGSRMAPVVAALAQHFSVPDNGPRKSD